MVSLELCQWGWESTRSQEGGSPLNEQKCLVEGGLDLDRLA